MRAAGPLSVFIRQAVDEGAVDYDKGFFNVKKLYLWTGQAYLTYMRAEVCAILMNAAALKGEIDVTDEDAKGFVQRAAQLAADAKAEYPALNIDNSGLCHESCYGLYSLDPEKLRRAQSLIQQQTLLKPRTPKELRPKTLTDVSICVFGRWFFAGYLPF